MIIQLLVVNSASSSLAYLVIVENYYLDYCSYFIFLYGSNLPDVQAGFRKGRGTRDQIANIRWIIDKAREFQETSISALFTVPKPLTVWITINCGKF